LMEALMGKLIEQFENGAFLARTADRQGRAGGAGHPGRRLGRNLAVDWKQPEAVMPAERDIEWQAVEPCRRPAWPIEMDFAHRYGEIMSVALLFERCAPANCQRQVQQGLQ